MTPTTTNPNPNLAIEFGDATLVEGTTPTPKEHQPYSVKVIEKNQMLEINPGVWDGLSPDQARKYYPEEWERFVKDSYAFRAPRAESYHDLCGASYQRGVWSHSDLFGFI